MHVISPIAALSNPEHRRSEAISAKWADTSIALLELFRPSVLSVLALILIVGGWTYGYRLSHYEHISNVTKASTIRMWVDQRHALVAVPVEQQARPHLLIGHTLCAFELHKRPHLTREELLATPIQSAVTTFVSPLHPLRAPPISLPLMA